MLEDISNLVNLNFTVLTYFTIGYNFRSLLGGQLHVDYSIFDYEGQPEPQRAWVHKPSGAPSGIKQATFHSPLNYLDKQLAAMKLDVMDNGNIDARCWIWSVRNKIRKLKSSYRE